MRPSDSRRHACKSPRDGPRARVCKRVRGAVEAARLLCRQRRCATTPSPEPVTSVKATAEKSIDVKAPPPKSDKKNEKPKEAAWKAISTGPKLPPEMRLQLQKQMEQRIDHDVGEVKLLRQEAVGLLTTFVAETPRESREMPEALIRLGELKWELEREDSTVRFAEWEESRSTSAGRRPTRITSLRVISSRAC